MRSARILDWVKMHRHTDRYNDVEPSSPPQSSPDYTIVIRGYNFREGHVTSERKIRANRANARASTGPKTAQGRSHAARNALRHALSLPVSSDPVLSEAVELLAHA